jgi:hypothetical protein
MSLSRDEFPRLLRVTTDAASLSQIMHLMVRSIPVGNRIASGLRVGDRRWAEPGSKCDLERELHDVSSRDSCQAGADRLRPTCQSWTSGVSEEASPFLPSLPPGCCQIVQPWKSIITHPAHTLVIQHEFTIITTNMAKITILGAG